MAGSTKIIVGQNMPKHTLGHIQAKLQGALGSRTTFVIVEGYDDHIFYERFFDSAKSSVYPSVKLKTDGTPVTGGCDETMHIVSAVLNGGKTQKIIGIIDTDYRKYRKNWNYPEAIFHTDRRDMEMTALSHPTVRAALRTWNPNIDSVINTIEPVVKHMGMLRVCNDVLSLGCKMGKVKIHDSIDVQHGNTILKDWKCVLTKKFLKQCFKQYGVIGSGRALLGLMWMNSMHMQDEDIYDLGQGHDTLLMMSYIMNDIRYSYKNIWRVMQGAYSVNVFHTSDLYLNIRNWQDQMRVDILK